LEGFPRESSDKVLTPTAAAASSRSPIPMDASRRAASPRFAANSPRFQAVSITLRHLEELDCKFMNQLAQTQQRSDQSRERLRAWMEQKMQTIIGVQTKNDMKVAELSGNMAALSDEVQSQVRRGELLDMKYWEWRRDFEEETRQKLADLEAKMEEAFASNRTQVVAAERSTLRVSESVRAIELLLSEQGRKDAAASEDLEAVSDRLARLEEQTQQSFQLLSTQGLSRDMGIDDGLQRAISADQERLFEVEQQIAQLDKANADARDAFGEITARLEAHEEKIKATRTVIDQQRELVLGTRAKFESMDVDGRVELAMRALANSKDKAEVSAEKMGVLTARLDLLEEAVESLRSLAIAGPSLQSVVTSPLPPPAVAATDELFSPGAPPQTAVVLERIPGAAVSVPAAAEAADGVLAARLEQLLQKLTSMGPAIVRHEEILRDLTSRGQLIETAAVPTESGAAGDPIAREQLERLAARMEAMTGLVESACASR